MDRDWLENLLATVIRSDASALHLMPDRPPCMRLQGRFVQTETPATSASELEDLGRELMFEDHRRRLARGEEVELLYTSRQGVRFRTLLLHEEGGIGALFRRVPLQVPGLADLGLPELLATFVAFRSGIVLLTGFVGAGKSTTLAAMVDRLNGDHARHVVTLEDPIEFVYEQKRAIVHQRELRRHVASVPEGIATALRQGAEVVVVSALRERADIEAILEAAERGALVIAALHASGIVGCLSDVLRLYPHDERGRTLLRLSTAMKVMVGQSLLQRSHQAGRIPLLEILINNPAVSRLLRAGEFHELPATMERHRGLGMQTIDMALKGLLNRNLITVDEALYHAVDRSWLSARTR